MTVGDTLPPAPVDPKKDRAQKPPTLAPLPDSIPVDLTALSQWVCWRWEWNEKRGAWSKPPTRLDCDRRASTTDPTTWGSFSSAVSRLKTDDVDGIGFVFTASDPFCGIDLDACRDPKTGELSADAKAVIELLQGYTEASVTGTGIHIIVRASMGELSGRKSGFLELYDRGRYFTVTGRRLSLEGLLP